MNSTETTPALNHVDHARAYLAKAADGCREALVELGREIAEQDAFYALTWKGEGALVIAARLRELRACLRGWDLLVENGTTEQLVEMLDHEIARRIKALTGADYGTTDGPWTPNSSSAMSNLGNIAEANAMRALLIDFKRARARVLGQDKTAEYWAE